MKQNKDREEFMARYEGANTVQSSISSFMANDIWQWIETHTQKKVKEALNNILEENHCDLDGTYDYNGIAESVIKLAEKL